MSVLSPLPRLKWSRDKAAHLLNRAGFGGTPSEIDAAYARGLAATLSQLVDFDNAAARVPPPVWAHPRNIREARMELQSKRDQPEERKEQLREIQMTENNNILDLRQWWLDRMMNSPAPLLEKMTLFWHGHFATSIEKVKDAYWIWLQNETLRRNALGNFTTLTRQMSRDPAMMIYLDLQQSHKEHPNENWARELMELFTVGIGNYTENDVREAARAFTAYRIDLTTQKFRFAPMQQDRTNKNFMGRTGPLIGDDIIDILVSKPVCAQFIGRKLWRFFVEDEPTPESVEQIAKTIRAHNFEFRPVLREIFNSELFYSDRAMGSQVKSPVQYVVQTSKTLESPLPSALAAQNAMRQMGQTLFAPPNVKGWDGGKAWITTSTLLFRYNFANYLINGDEILPAAAMAARGKAGPGFRRTGRELEKIQRDPINVGKIAPVELRDKPEELVSLLTARIFSVPVADKERQTFIGYLEARKPDTSDQTVRGLIHLMMSTPQFQLT